LDTEKRREEIFEGPKKGNQKEKMGVPALDNRKDSKEDEAGDEQQSNKRRVWEKQPKKKTKKGGKLTQKVGKY
jgi:hypothetical protein